MARFFGYLLAAGALLLTTSSASADYLYTAASFLVFDSQGHLISADSMSVSYAQAISDGSGTVYEIANANLANSVQYGNVTTLSTGGNANGPYFNVFGVDFNSLLAFTWDPTGNDPYGSNGNAFDSYIYPPTQPFYNYSATIYLSSALTSVGDTAVFQLTTLPEPASLAMLATGGLMITAYGRFRRRKS
jgi:hypothetical protein